MKSRLTISQFIEMKPYYISSANNHSMGESLHQYVKMKMHHLLLEKQWKKIFVRGTHDRNHTIISSFEKSGKIENWQRPTAIVNESEITIFCFPGHYYVEHYASLISTYLALNNMDPTTVAFQYPTEKECWNPIINSGLESIPISDWLIIGSGLTEIASSGIWQEIGNYTFSQQKSGSVSVTYLLCHHCFWGDTLYRITRHLVGLGHKRVLFTAKVAGIRPDLIPNYHLATGDTTVLDNRVWQWNNIFKDIKHPQLAFGTHLNSANTIMETKALHRFIKPYDFLDSEIGFFIQGSEEAEERSYLHFISNNLSKEHDENLSNERNPEIIKKRNDLAPIIRSLIQQAINR